MLLSTERNANKEQIVCENAVFDPSLMKDISIDKIEKYVSFEYDFNECGHPLKLPFKADYVEFGVRLTPHGIHISAIANPLDSELADFEYYINPLGDIGFDVQMSSDERASLLGSVLLYMIQGDERPECIPEFEDDEG